MGECLCDPLIGDFDLLERKCGKKRMHRHAIFDAKPDIAHGGAQPLITVDELRHLPRQNALSLRAASTLGIGPLNGVNLCHGQKSEVTQKAIDVCVGRA